MFCTNEYCPTCMSVKAAIWGLGIGIAYITLVWCGMAYAGLA